MQTELPFMREHTCCCRCSLGQAAPVVARRRAASAVPLLQWQPVGRVHCHLQCICNKVHTAFTPDIQEPKAALACRLSCCLSPVASSNASLLGHSYE